MQKYMVQSWYYRVLPVLLDTSLSQVKMTNAKKNDIFIKVKVFIYNDVKTLLFLINILSEFLHFLIFNTRINHPHSMFMT